MSLAANAGTTTPVMLMGPSSTRGMHAGVRDDATAHAVYRSLIRPVLTLGVERHVAGLEITLCLALVFGVGLSVATAALVALVLVLMHPALVWVTAREPLVTELYVRSQQYADYYAPHASVHRPVPRPRPSMPRLR